jgi:polysaccharide deacetylase 2 family uncharacterized protein YibQ
MPRDELSTPLHKRSFTQRLWARRPGLLALAYSLALTGFAAGSWWLVAQPLPFAGEPVVIAAVPPVEEVKTAAIDPAPPVEIEQVDAQPLPAKTSSKSQNENPDIAINDGTEIFTNPHQSLAKAPIAGLVENSDQGPLPKIGLGGKKPSDAYARMVSANAVHSDQPKIAIILGGMGLNDKLTARAARDLTGDITFAFAPYGPNLQDQVNKAREQGHEILLQLPLEPVGFPASNPGPKTLLADADTPTNLQNLQWHMSRFTGYAGVVNYMGGRFMAAPEAVKPMLAELKKRGLYFVEDGSLPLSSTDDVAQGLHQQVRHADIVIDANPDAQSIADALSKLEEQARSQGFAMGTGSGLAVTVDTVRDWAKSARDRGIILVPATAAFKGRLG